MNDSDTLLRYVAPSPSAARRFVRETLATWSRHDLADDAELLVSELVTNVFMHTAAASAAVGMAHDDRTVRVEVTDPDPEPLRRVPKTDRTVPGGLGLGIVEAIASHWGVEQEDTRKTVWFELTTPDRMALAS